MAWWRILLGCCLPPKPQVLQKHEEKGAAVDATPSFSSEIAPIAPTGLAEPTQEWASPTTQQGEAGEDGAGGDSGVDGSNAAQGGTEDKEPSPPGTQTQTENPDISIKPAKVQEEIVEEIEDERERVQRFIHLVLEGDVSGDPMSLLKDSDGQLVVNVVWKLLDPTESFSPEITGMNWSTFGRVFLQLVMRFGTIPASPVFLAADQHSQADLGDIGDSHSSGHSGNGLTARPSHKHDKMATGESDSTGENGGRRGAGHNGSGQGTSLRKTYCDKATMTDHNEDMSSFDFQKSPTKANGRDGGHLLPEAEPVGSAQDEQNRIANLIHQLLHEELDIDFPVLPEDRNGQLVIDEVWRLLGRLRRTPGTSEDHRGQHLRLCLKLVLRFNRLPTALFLTDVQYKEVDLLGSGGFADVFRGICGTTVVAVKRLREFLTMTDEQKLGHRRSLYRESLLWKLLDHPNVLPLTGVWVDALHQNTMIMVLPLMQNGGIRNYIDKLQSEGKLPTSGPDFITAINAWVHQVALGLAYLHEQQIVHGDLHCANILVDVDGNARLTDFGMALIANATSYNYASVHGGGALFTRAPELLDPEAPTTRPTPACDVYSFAYVCIELYTGKRPFPGAQDFQLIHLVREGKRPPRPQILNGDAVSENMWSLIPKCWDEEPSKRPSSGELAQTIEKIVDYSNGKLPLSLTHTQVCTFGVEDRWPFRRTLSHDHLILGEDNGTIRVYSITIGKLLHVLRGHENKITAVVGTQGMLLSASRDATLRIWDLLTGRCLHIFRGHTNDINALAVTYPGEIDGTNGGKVDSGPIIVSGGGHGDSSLRVWNLPPPPSEPELQKLEPIDWPVQDNPYHKYHLETTWKSIRGLAAEGSTVVCNDSSGHLEVWDIMSGERKWAFQHEGEGDNVTLLYLDNQRHVVGSIGKSARIWNTHTGEGHDVPNVSDKHLKCDSSGSFIVSQLRATGTLIWDSASGELLRRLVGSDIPKDSRYGWRHAHDDIKAIGGYHDSLKLWDIKTGLLAGDVLNGRFEVKEVLVEGSTCVAILKGQEGNIHVVVWNFGGPGGSPTSEAQ